MYMSSAWLHGMEHMAVPRAQGPPNAVHGRVGGRSVHVDARSRTKATAQHSGKVQCAKLDQRQGSLRYDRKRDRFGPNIS